MICLINESYRDRNVVFKSFKSSLWFVNPNSTTYTVNYVKEVFIQVLFYFINYQIPCFVVAWVEVGDNNTSMSLSGEIDDCLKEGAI